MPCTTPRINRSAAEPPMSRKRPDAEPIALDSLPGHQIRRLQQIAVAIFLQDTEAHGVTPVQFGVLQALHNQPGVDQRTLARNVGLDASTIGGVVDRLEARGWVQRALSAADRRVRLLTLTDAGRTTLGAVVPAMAQAQARMLAPLSAAEQAEFMRMLNVLVAANNELSRAPAP